ncbi:hypothetical protein K0M31_001748 [Melipona bicolor]|uniref:Cilia- and flagella-associated protein 44 n=1 Tax=Melipona bicolor TaxID=60889 RepID=A0AA40GGE0_9HYME|nr:hypothetical protein K0M31_001748 [Melipona bicolor]
MADGGKFEFENNKDLKENVELDYERKENFEINKEERSNEGYTFMGRQPEHGIDTNTIAFAAGTLIQFFNVKENRMWFKIGSAGTGIGHISKNSVFKHIAVGANGENPVINIFNWPNMEPITVLKGGTTKRYFHLSYSPDGLLLVSQGGEPDYYISLWNWKESNIILQCKSHVQDVYNVTFSKYIPGQLTSSGVGHIKFWKMSKTFTGLKLKGEIGKFGNTEIFDIIAIHPMSNETVVSGCEWGNILLWDESLIKLEACRKNRKTAHVGYITQFEYINGELMSVGSDGWIRFWFYETIDHADLSDDEQFLEIQPIYEFQIAEGNENAMLMSIQKQEPNSEKTMWYAQDGNGGLWLLDLCTSKKEHVQQKVFTCHAGPIVDMDIAEWGPFVATLDKNGNLHIYNYIEKELSLIHKFYDTSRQVIWLPCKIEKTGSTLVCAFENGIVRMITITIYTSNTAYNIKKNSTKLIQVLKPHSMPITVMSLNEACSLLVTGSDDATIFVFNIHTINNYPTIIPIGYVKLPTSITCMAWNPQEEATLLIGCLKGYCVEIKLPTTPQAYTTTSYELVKCKSVSFKFESVKSAIEREAIKKKYEEEKEERLKERKKEMEKLIAENPHIVIDEETFLREFNEKEVILPEIYIPEIPNKVLIAQYSINENIWLFMAGFDAGYVYEYPRPLSGKLKHNKPIRSRIIEHAKDIEIHNFFIQENKKYLYLGTQYGQLYVIKLKETDPLDFSDFWILQTHDYYNGHISNILLSYNKNILLTCGHDGNIFAFKINDDTPLEEHEVPKLEDSLFIPKNVEDIEDANYPNLEEIITKIEQDRIFAVAEEKKKQILEIIRDLTEEFVKITTRNKYLLHSQQISQFELDPRIVEDLKQQLNIHTTLTQQKLEFEVGKSKLELQKLMDHFVTPITYVPFAVHGMLNEIRAVYSLRELQLDTESILKSIELMKQQDKPLKIGRIIQEQIEEEKHEPEVLEIQYFEAFLSTDLTNVASSLKIQINQMLSKYKGKKARMIERQRKWQKLYEKKPNLVKSRFKDAVFLEEAKLTIGEYDLKMNADFCLIRRKETAAIKYKQLIDCRKKLHHLRENFNTKLKTIALKKQKLQKEVIKLIEVLKRIHTEIPLKNIKPLPHPPKLNLDIEFPEHNLELEKYISISEKMQQVKRQRQSLVVDQFIDHSDLEYEVLYCDDKTILHKEQESFYTLVPSKIKIKGHLSANDIIRNLNVSDSVQTTWEHEMKRSRMWRKIYEQDCILRYIDAEYKKLENELDELEEHRLDVVYQSTYINLNLLTLYEEFIILRDSETMEHALEEKVTDKSNECISVKSKMQATNINIVAREEQIKKLHIKIKDIAAEFTKAISDSSLDTVTRSTETTSDETDETTDTEAEYISFDENICPSGCDTQLYEMAFSMREKRYTCEFKIREEQKEIELLQKELDTDTKYLRVLESTLKNNEEELQNFMLDKQKKLNEINVTVILKLHQLQHILDSESIENIQNCIIFNKKELTNLYARVEELQDETHNLEETRKKNETHLKRIKMDLKYMDTQNKKLKQYIKEKMIQKFGRKVSLINLYVIILQRLIYDTKTDVNKIMKDFTKDIENAKQNCNEKLIILESLIRNNTEKLSFLTILEKEKFKLRKILEQTLISEENMLQVEHEHKADIVTLESILYNQIQQKHMLQYDIESLKTGSKKLPEICLNQNIS